jgi:hypothetical protein
MSCLLKLSSTDVDSELLVSLAKLQYTRDDEPGMGTVGQLMIPLITFRSALHCGYGGITDKDSGLE